MHIAVVVGGTMWLVRHLLLLSPWIALRWPVKIIAAGVAALAGIAYTLLAGAEVPTVRSCLATLIVLIGLCLGRQAISLRMVAAAAFLILLVRPEALLGPSFQLSFAAVTAIVVFYQSRVGRSLAARSEAGVVRRFGQALVALVLTGVLVEAALAPIALGHFGRTGFYGVLANVIAIPFTSFVVMPAAAAALLLDPLGLAAPAHAVLAWSLDLLIGLADTVAGWPGAVSRLPTMPTLAFAGFIVGGLWLFLWESRVRWAGVVPILVATGLAFMAQPADLVVSNDGRHAGLVTDGRLAMLRPRAGSFIGDMWGDATATAEMVGWSDGRAARCNRDACVTVIARGGREWRLLATKSKALLDWRALTRACAGVDIVVSERWLPDACRPRWLKLDRAQLARTGAVAIWFDPLRVRTVADVHGDHPWATAAPAQWYRRSKPTSLPWIRTRDGR
jgi:competence protein ComEC